MLKSLSILALTMFPARSYQRLSRNVAPAKIGVCRDLGKWRSRLDAGGTAEQYAGHGHLFVQLCVCSYERFGTSCMARSCFRINRFICSEDFALGKEGTLRWCEH
ncbi:hypothetical protein CC86DRAFT_92276 [Ophiobolus disseminans]|uniref:Uncharacterized protein n=1 Tax=Ophiobolus disseminans TaxID=1469910 RepID=A0A6A7AH63_9PLEO|nr:hypothetical protein CC86DRAFT_92276 [Ophiobolus disseminans]